MLSEEVAMRAKVSVSTDKHAWHPSPLIGQIVLVTTLNEDGVSNIATKSLVTMASFDPPVLALGCNAEHWTARNILRSGEFVVNVPGEELAETAWLVSDLPHPRPVEAAGLTPVPSEQVAPPRVDECLAHLECTLDRHIEYGLEVLLLGRVVSVSIDSGLADLPDAYAKMRLIAYLEEGRYGVVERSTSVRL